MMQEESEQFDLKRLVSEFSADTVRTVIQCTDEVLAAGTNLVIRQVFFPKTEPDPFAENKAIVDACNALEDFWRPRVQQYICRRILGTDPSTDLSSFQDYEIKYERWTRIVAREVREELISQTLLGHRPPYGLPRSLASSPIDQGGYAGWDRDLLLSPYEMRGIADTVVTLMPYDAPGMMDALAYCAAVKAIGDLALPSEAYRLHAARPFAPDLDGGGVPWDCDRAIGRLAELRMRCERTPAGSLVFAINVGMRNPDVEASDLEALVDRCVRSQNPSDTPTCRAKSAAKAIGRAGQSSEDMSHAAGRFADGLEEEYWDRLRTVVTKACSDVYGRNGAAVRRASKDLMRFFEKVVREGALAATAGDGDVASPQRHGHTGRDEFFCQKRDSIRRLFQEPDPATASVAADGRAREAVPNQRGLFRRFTIDKQWRSELDPVLAVGFVALDAGVAMPEAAYLLDLTEGWSRLVWDATILSSRPYGSAVPGDLDVAAGVCEIREHYDEVVPTLEPIWREAFERQWKIFESEMKTAKRLYAEALWR